MRSRISGVKDVWGTRLKTVNGPSPVEVGGEWADARVADGQGAAPVLDEHPGALAPQPRIAGAEPRSISGLGIDRSEGGEK